MVRLLLALIGMFCFFWLLRRNRKTAREVTPWLKAEAVSNECAVDKDKRLRAMEYVMAQTEYRKTSAMGVALFGLILSAPPLILAPFSWQSWILLGMVLANCLMWWMAYDWGKRMWQMASELPKQDQEEVKRLLRYRIARENYHRLFRLF